MKRDKNLMLLLLLQARDGEQPELAHYPEDAKLYNAGLLLEDGLLRGDSIPGNDGNPISIVMEGLTSAGHDVLDNWEAEMSNVEPGLESESELAIFISHAGKDSKLAAALVDLLRFALNLEPADLRCTSVDGYRFEAGTNTDAQLKKEVRASKAFVGLITPSSIQSAYVLFELGARWGADLHLAPLLACGADAETLRGPLRGLNASDGTSEAQMHQLVENIASRLGRRAASPAVYGKVLALFVAAASDSAETSIETDSPHVDEDIRKTAAKIIVDIVSRLRVINESVDKASSALESIAGLPSQFVHQATLQAEISPLIEIEEELIQEALNVYKDTQWSAFRDIWASLSALNREIKDYNEFPTAKRKNNIRKWTLQTIPKNNLDAEMQSTKPVP